MNYSLVMLQLPLVRETTNQRLRTPADLAKVCSDLEMLAQEAFHVLTLDTKNHLINRHMVTLGLANASLVHPREVFRAALTEGGPVAAIVLVHNHPSGDSGPSADDIRITKQIVEAGKILDIPVLDHVIIGRRTETNKGFFSMRESGICDFSQAA